MEKPCDRAEFIERAPDTFAGSGHEVKTVMVAGVVLVRDGELLTADEAAIRTEAQVRAEEAARRVAAGPVHKEMALPSSPPAGHL